LFSSMKHTLMDDQTSMTSQNWSTCIVTKEQLNSGLGQGSDGGAEHPQILIDISIIYYDMY
ncbi:hypothetical protein B0H14DRAFT_2347764, partial [Mycena olivaceomarginata]